ncbi:hypothetical protein TREMEDRAFT_61767 [Tremella mesenterica DSM 1558]|uniref:uncharacterized protein n=1 Tax=Tremella mesenterica (strain ATCC 24925 / CBS 8224 / DSM 1558 / NBRC 9311 / NRRL Y-6157 / RJB 2259-6 / UBC 559-6) TaxID=578456 RepID=UPI0003F49C30|nr:uncharacterized protein TREMEDRAFT_61767 [Tremella mesenterica DSM 1558]EIW70001.1 hypothetical protein TREMEDRAFT_61767 [Tremella mesenterica DSM 1558]
MSTPHLTPILSCLDHGSITATLSSPPLHPYQSPNFSIPAPILRHLRMASDHLHAGRTVAFPTETVYGLGASTLSSSAVSLIYKIKNRPSDNPLIVHVSSLDMLQRLLPPSYTLSPLYKALISSFWPGPLTLLFPSPNPPPLPAPQTLATRMPAHPLALALISVSDLPLSAPSANSSGRPSPTTAEHVRNDLAGSEGLGCILDGGSCDVGVESTVVNGLDWREGGGGSVDVLRPGGLGVEEIARIVQEVDGKAGRTQVLVLGKPWNGGKIIELSGETKKKNEEVKLAPVTPGQKYRHYSPRVPVYLLLPSNTFPSPPSSSTKRFVPTEVIQHIVSHHKVKRLGLLHYDESPLSHQLLAAKSEGLEIIPSSLGRDATSGAQRLFSGLLSLESQHRRTVDDNEDQIGVDAILVEGCSEEGIGLAVMERLGKAVGGGGKTGDVGNDDHQGEVGRYWVQV